MMPVPNDGNTQRRAGELVAEFSQSSRRLARLLSSSTGPVFILIFWLLRHLKALPQIYSVASQLHVPFLDCDEAAYPSGGRVPSSKFFIHPTKKSWIKTAVR
jgi:hypothetical protein